MSESLAEQYNFRGSPYTAAAENRFEGFKHTTHAGDIAPNFTLPLLDGGELSLSSLRGKPVVIEFGSIT